MTAQEDYRFQTTVTWNPPVYPYKNVQMYIVRWFERDSNARTGFKFTNSGFTVSLVAFFPYFIALHVIMIVEPIEPGWS